MFSRSVCDRAMLTRLNEQVPARSNSELSQLSKHSHLCQYTCNCLPMLQIVTPVHLERKGVPRQYAWKMHL